MKQKSVSDKKALYPSGRTVLLQETRVETEDQKTKSISVKLSEIEDKRFFSEILFLDGYVRDHFSHHYEEMVGAKDLVA
jgi:hypothetical protein